MNTSTAAPKKLLAQMFDSLKSIAVKARDEVTVIDQKIAELRAQRDVIEHAMPHAEDLAAWLARNIDRHAERFYARARRHLHESTLRQQGWAALDVPEIREGGFAVFRLGNSVDPSTRADSISPIERDHMLGEPIDASALIALLAEPLKAAAGDFIRRTAPCSLDGMRAADRAAKLADIDAELQKLGKERAEILDALRKTAGAAEPSAQ
jgi:hypothetical protein